MNNYLDGIDKEFKYYKLLGDKTFEQLDFDQLKYESAEEFNSIAIMVKHLAGNMQSRWTNFLIEDGKKEWRNRDLEFENTL